jgi:hypothetical protein
LRRKSKENSTARLQGFCTSCWPRINMRVWDWVLQPMTTDCEGSRIHAWRSMYGWACETKRILVWRSVLLDKWNEGFVLEEVHGLACETKALCSKKCMVAHVKLKGF